MPTPAQPGHGDAQDPGPDGWVRGTGGRGCRCCPVDWTAIFDGWGGVLRVLVVGTLAYAVLVAALRVSGKRTLSKMNAFDFVVTVALGSTLATVLLSEEVALAEGVAALGLLIALQYAITFASVRSDRVQGWVKGEPTLLARDGRLLPQAMHRARVTRAEVDAALRAAGIAALGDAGAVILETDGSISALPRP
jgi:uncharacterized membrane protein YcaP (DUF421 family)